MRQKKSVRRLGWWRYNEVASSSLAIMMDCRRGSSSEQNPCSGLRPQGWSYNSNSVTWLQCVKDSKNFKLLINWFFTPSLLLPQSNVPPLLPSPSSIHSAPCIQDQRQHNCDKAGERGQCKFLLVLQVWVFLSFGCRERRRLPQTWTCARRSDPGKFNLSKTSSWLLYVNEFFFTP